MKIYCGNNNLNRSVVDGYSRVGTRHECLQKGVNIGMHMKKDDNFTGPYDPIDKRLYYCGNDTILPENYDVMGNLPKCLQKGIGIGKKRSYETADTLHDKINKIFNFKKGLFISFIVTFFIVLVSIISDSSFFIYTLKSDDEHKIRIKWLHMILFYLLVSIILSIRLFTNYI